MQVPEFDRLKKQFHNAMNMRPPVTNLVFKGGGIRGVAYLGALQVFDQYGLLDGLKRVGGTSAGSLTALLLSMRLSIESIEKTLASIEFPSMAQEIDSRDGHGLVKNIVPDTACLQRFRSRFGWYSNENMYKTIQEIVASGCKGNGRATFADFEKMGHRSLFIVASNVSRFQREVFSVKTTPNIAVADAALMSSSIPIFFEPVRFDGQKVGEGDYYVDGGLYDNYPIHVFDHIQYVSHKRNFKEGINLETLGLFLYPPRHDKDEAHLPRRWNEFIELVFSNLYHSHQVKSLITSTADEERTIRINDCGIKATDFKITAGSEKYDQLLHSGKTAAQKFLKSKKYI